MKVSSKKKTEAIIEKCLQLIPIPDFQTILKLDLEEIEKMAMVEKAFLEDTQPLVPIDNHSKTFLWGAISGFLETMISIFHFFEVGRSPTSAWEASQFLSLYGTLFTIPLALFGILTTFVSSIVALYITAGTVAFVNLFVLAYGKWFRPRPIVIEGSRNLTLEASEGKIPRVWNRTQEIKEITKNLTQEYASYMGGKQFLIIVGEPGVGKTALVGGIARLALQNTPLKDYYIHHEETANLIDDNYTPDHATKLERFCRQIKRDDKAIFFCDNLQYGDIKDKDGKPVFWIKLLAKVDRLDKFIAATTRKGYDELVAKLGENFQRRFKPIVLKPAEPLLIEEILHYIQRCELERNIYIPEETINYLIQESNKLKERVQPDIAKKLIHQAIVDVDLSRLEKKDKIIDNLIILQSTLYNLAKEMVETAANQSAVQALKVKFIFYKNIYRHYKINLKNVENNLYVSKEIISEVIKKEQNRP